MNLLVPHTVLVVSALRINLDWLRPARVLGPGVYHFESDLRPKLRTLSQTKDVARGFVEVRFQSGDTVQVLKDLLAEANASKTMTPEARHARISFIYGLAAKAGVDLASNAGQAAPVANLESNEAPVVEEPVKVEEPVLAELLKKVDAIPDSAPAPAPVAEAPSSPAGDEAVAAAPAPVAPAADAVTTAAAAAVAAALDKKSKPKR